MRSSEAPLEQCSYPHDLWSWARVTGEVSVSGEGAGGAGGGPGGAVEPAGPGGAAGPAGPGGPGGAAGPGEAGAGGDCVRTRGLHVTVQGRVHVMCGGCHASSEGQILVE